jgi:phosphoribosylformylglycinamidine synthase I
VSKLKNLVIDQIPINMMMSNPKINNSLLRELGRRHVRMARVAIAVFPGSNCERDVQNVLDQVFDFKPELVWHTKSDLSNYDAVIIPGGFSYGDRLRAGSIAAHSPIITEIKRLAKRNVPILGICNGFQILVEAGLLPGALAVNNSLKFICKWVRVKVVNRDTPFTWKYREGDIFNIPVAHGEGRYFADADTINRMKSKNQIVVVYSGENPNGSVEAVAGICNEHGNVVGIMPHPERGSESILSPVGLRNSFDSLRAYCRSH